MTSPIGEPYLELADEEVTERIKAVQAALGKEVLILGHHYQTEDVLRFADIKGDSYELSKQAAQSDAHLIVFCGVHFMAESADILTRPDQVVVMPDIHAGCPMADMASIGELESAWIQLSELGSPDEIFTPVTYINSTAEVKAFCGLHGGIVCTSANASKALSWALKQRPKAFFLPDRHLGLNTALAQKIDPQEITLWDPVLPLGGNTIETLKKARIVLWKGHCHVHTRFLPDHVIMARKAYPEAKVVVHPECCHEVVALSDATGSTGFIVRFVEQAEPGSTIIIGTEINLVSRLARQYRDRTILPLISSMCPNMYKNSIRDLLYVLENHGKLNVVRVADELREPALQALQRMLAL